MNNCRLDEIGAMCVQWDPQGRAVLLVLLAGKIGEKYPAMSEPATAGSSRALSEHGDGSLNIKSVASTALVLIGHASRSSQLRQDGSAAVGST